MRMKNLQLSTILATLLIAPHAATANGIKIQTEQVQAGTPVSIDPNVPEFISNHLRVIASLDPHIGKCEQTSSRLKRQVACIQMEDGKLTVNIPKTAGVIEKNTLSLTSSRQLFGLSGDETISIAKSISQKITKTDRTVLDTKLAIVAKRNDGTYILKTTNYDGSAPIIIHRSSEPILSPSWSPSGRYISYVSYESIRASVVIYDTVNNKRVKAITMKGLNAYPSFKTDNELLISISNESRNSNIYTHNIKLNTNQILQKSKSADIFPRSLSGNKYAKVSLKNDGTPYGYIVKDGTQSPIIEKPLNAISASKNDFILGMSNSDLLLIELRENGRHVVNKIASDRKIESPSISFHEQAVLYSTQKNGRSVIKLSFLSGKEILTLESTDEQLIQVAAY